MKITKEMLINGSIELISNNKIENFNARSLAKKLNCSTQPIFYNFSSMDDLMHDVCAEVFLRYKTYIKENSSNAKYPPYKASGMAYINYAREYPNLFMMLFMRSRTSDDSCDDLNNDLDVGIISGISASLDISVDEAKKFHREMWIFVHGIATMVVTGFAAYTEAEISDMMTDIYSAMAEKYRHSGKLTSLFKPKH